MSRSLLVCSAAAVVLTFAGPTLAQETPRAIIEKAIKAHGGEANLAKLRAVRMKTKGEAHLNDQTFPFTTVSASQLPGQSRSAVDVDTGAGTINWVFVANSKKSWQSFQGRL